MMIIVNFAHGDFVMLGMYVAFVVWTLFGVGPLVGAPVAALVLATLGIIVYFGLIRSVMRGPMLAQILGTFGLALLLRYSVFWGFGANFMTLPENLVGGTFDVLGIRIQASRLLAGVVALLVTLGLHLLLTRTSLGSKMLAVAEDSTAAQLMGIRPDSMQAIAWAIAAAATGIAGALIATFFYIAPTVGETLRIVAFVTVSLGGIPVGIAAAVLIAAVIGVPTLRLSGHYFSMATIAVAELVRLIVTNTEYLGAAVGLSGPTVPRTVLDLSFTSALPYYYLFLSVLVITLGITWWMTNSRMGFYLRAIKDSERAARSLGAPASRTKLYAFMLSAGLTSVAGALYAMMFGFVDPDSGLGILISVKILIMAALGGAGLLFGPLVGAAILVPLEEISNNLLGGKGAGLTFVVYGAIIVLIARFQPGGILTLIKRLWARRGKTPEAPVAAGATHAP